MRRSEVYFNLHKKTFSIRALFGKDKGRVVAHQDYVGIKDPRFIVQSAGREKVLKEKRKNVHAFVRGHWMRPSEEWFPSVDPEWFPDTDSMIEVTYNPYKYDSFVIKSTGKPIKEAKYAFLNNRKIWVDKGKNK